MTLTALVTLVVMNLIGAASPGPDILLITRLGIRSRRHAYAAALGIQTGVFVWVTLTVFGFGALLNAVPSLLGVLQFAGGSWLIWMGISSLRAGWADRTSPPMDLAAAVAKLGRLRHSYLQGLSTNLSNPKIAIYLSAMIAPLLPPNPTIGEMVIIILAMWLSAVALQMGVARVVSTKRIQNKLFSAGPWIDIASGAFFSIVGVVLLVRGASLLMVN